MQSAQPAQPQEQPLSQIPRRPAGSGLLSNWKSAQQAQQAQQGPVTGVGQQNPHTNLQSLMSGPVSPHQSGVSSLPAFYNAPNGNGHNSNSNGYSGNGNMQPANPQPLQSLSPNFNMQGPQSQNVPPFQSFNPQQPVQPVNGQSAPPFNPPQQPFIVGPGTQQPNQPFGPQSMPGQPGQPNQFNQTQNHDPWLQRPGGNGNLPPNANRPGGRGPNGGKGNGGGGKKSRKKKRRFPIWARIAVAILAVLMVLIGSGVWYYEANFAGAVSTITNQQVSRIQGEENPNANRDPNNILSGGRINILLLGSDTDQKFGNIFLAQTDIVVTIDPKSGNVAMLSIPRDTWLRAAQSNGADNGMMKLDQTYGRGGIRNTRATIEQVFGIPINYYAWVGLNGFIKVIDTVGGIDIDVQHPITDDNYPDDIGTKDQYAYKRLDLAPGPQHLDGPTALEYVRSRHADLVGDFGRSARQQQVLSQLKTKLQNAGIINQLPAIANDLQGYVTTDMQLPQVFQVMNFARGIDQSKIKQVVLDGTYSRTVASYQTSYGPQDIVVLNCATVQPLIAQLFSLGNQAQCNTGISYNGTPQPVASVAPTTPHAAVAQTTMPTATTSSVTDTANTADTADAADIWQTAGQMANLSATSIKSGPSNLFGLRSLLDLLCFVTFETPTGLQV